MKKLALQIILFMLCVMMTLSMVACDGSGDVESTPAINSDTVAAATDVETGSSASADATDASDASTDTPQQGSVNTAGAVGESARVDASYFDNAAFVGDSVSLKLSYYAAATGSLGDAQFFTAGSLGAANALWEVSDESVHPSYQGEKMLVEDCVAKSGADTLYIMLGMNDIGLYGIDDTINNYETLISRVLEKSPNIKIVIQSMTPMTSTSTILGESLNNENIKIYNSRLSELSAEKGWAFVDVASVMYDAEGVSLNRDYCSDPDDLGVHFTEAGCDRWVEYLSTHTP